MKRWTLTMERKRSLEGYMFVSPWIIGFCAFFAFPLLISIRLSFSTVTKIAGFQMEWVGWDNYANAFLVDVNFIPLLTQSIENTLINTPMIVIFALLLAILVNHDIKFKGFFRGLYFLPVILGSGMVLQQLLGQNVTEQAVNISRGVGIPPEILAYLGPTVSDALQAFLGRFTLILWKSGVQVLLFLAGLQGISSSLYESARCDGATEWEMFWKITLPMISPVILLTVIYTIIDSFTDVTNPLVNYFISKSTATAVGQFGIGAAMSWVYTIFIFIVIAIAFAIFRPFVYNAGEK